MRGLRGGAALAALVLVASAGLAGTASAQSYDRLIVFGDYLSDNGNQIRTTFGTLLPPPFFDGRFSNGPVFPELLGFDTAREDGPINGSINFAYGLSRTDNSRFYFRVGYIPGIPEQVTRYVGRGGVFGSDDLVSLQGGYLNLTEQMGAYGRLPPDEDDDPTGFVTSAIDSAVSDMRILVDDIASRGAGTILVTNLLPLENEPAMRTSTLRNLAEFSSSRFNGGLQATLLDLAPTRPGANIILFDLAKIGDVLVANPERFGLTNTTENCLVTVVRYCSNPDGYLFWTQLLTAAGHRLVATLAGDYLYYGDRGAQTTMQAETAYRHREEALDFVTTRLSGRDRWEGGVSLVGGALYDATDYEQRGAVARGDSVSQGAQLALEGGSEAVRLGVAGGWRVTDVDAGAMAFEVQTLSLDLYGGWRRDAFFLNGAIGMANEDFNDITRVSALPALLQIGETQGLSTGARIQGGMWIEAGAVAISPRAAITYVTSDVDGYTEQGFAAAYAYRDREVNGASAEIALRAEGEVSDYGAFAEIGFRNGLQSSSEAVRVGIEDNPAQVLSRRYGNPFKGSILASAGLNGELGPVLVEIGYRGRFGDHAESHTGGVTLTLPLR